MHFMPAARGKEGLADKKALRKSEAAERGRARGGTGDL